LKTALDGLDPWRLTAVAQMTQVLGSLVLALAVAEVQIDARKAFELSVLDEVFQAERWGEDREAIQRRRAMESEIISAGRFLDLL
jgi:chaperone required for assembly of F1-ATPase